MMSKTDLEAEVVKVVDGYINERREVRTSWVTHEIVSGHKRIQGADSDWYEVTAYGFITALVRKAIQKHKASDTTDEQLLLPGYDRLQSAYLTQRDGESSLVPIELLTDEELRAKEDELIGMSAGCIKHAEELREYRATRKAMATQ